jgi:hypothetical protein
MLANLRALFGVFVDIMFLRRGPEQLPPSRQLLAIIAIVHIVVQSLADHMFIAPLRPEPVPVLPGQVMAAFLMMLWFRIALQLAGKPERFVQTMIAVFFIGLVSALMVPLEAAMLPSVLAAKDSAEAAAGVPASVMLLASIGLFWILAMLSRVVKSAFEWSWGRSIIFVLLSTFGVPLLLAVIFGGGAKPA